MGSSLTILEENGYCVLSDFITVSECDTLIEEQNRIIKQTDHRKLEPTIFNTGNQEHAQNEYFLNSGRNISFFYEKDAFGEDGTLLKTLSLSLNKIGHALHDENNIFRKFTYQRKFKKLAQELGLKEPQIIQSMYIYKQPSIGDKVDLHQDSTFIYTEPETCLGFWFALEDATVENGCLWAHPGDHKGPLKERMVRHSSLNRVSMEKWSEDAYELGEAVPLEAKKGTLIVLHGRLPHFSQNNKSQKSRHAFALHLVDKKASYPRDNWLQETADRPFQDWPNL